MGNWGGVFAMNTRSTSVFLIGLFRLVVVESGGIHRSLAIKFV
jgi:hypothetical protein